MNKKRDLTPTALYARVSSDHQDVDLSMAAQLRALRDYADKNGNLATYHIDPGNGHLEPLATYPVGQGPMWVLIIDL